MPVPRTQRPAGIRRGVRVGDSVQGISRELIHRRDILVAGPAALARDPAINNVDRLRPHILAHLQVLVVAHAVRRTIGPYVPEMLTLRDIAQRLPPDSTYRRIPLHETASGETDKTRGQGIDQRRQVRSQPVLPSLPRILREERYHIQPKHGGGIGRDRQDSVRRVLCSRKRMPVSSPLVRRRYLKHIAQDRISHRVLQGHPDGTGHHIRPLGEKREIVSFPFPDRYPPVSLAITPPRPDSPEVDTATSNDRRFLSFTSSFISGYICVLGTIRLHPGTESPRMKGIVQPFGVIKTFRAAS